MKNGSKITRKLNFEFEIESNKIKRMVVIDGANTVEAREVSTMQEDSEKV